MFERFSLPDVAAVARRTMLSALIVGVLGLVLCLLLDQPWVALGLCVGLALGIGNFRLILSSVIKVGKKMGTRARRPLAMNTLSRLMALTVVALVVLWFLPPFGFGLIGGLAVFQFLLLFNVTRSMLKAGATAGGGPGSGALLMGLMGGMAGGDEDHADGLAGGLAGDGGGALPAAGDLPHDGWGAA